MGALRRCAKFAQQGEDISTFSEIGLIFFLKNPNRLFLLKIVVVQCVNPIFAF